MSADIIEEVIEKNGEDERQFLADVAEEAERLRQETAVKQQQQQTSQTIEPQTP